MLVAFDGERGGRCGVDYLGAVDVHLDDTAGACTIDGDHNLVVGVRYNDASRRRGATGKQWVAWQR